MTMQSLINQSNSILVIDTVFEQCSVAIWHNQQVIYSHTVAGKREQTQVVLPMIDTAINQTGLQACEFDAIAFNQGPGAFSGIRINTAVAQALSFAYDVPCVGVSSLQIMAQSAYEKYGYDHVFACLDARMQQVYVGEFAVQDGLMQPVNHGIKHGTSHGTSHGNQQSAEQTQSNQKQPNQNEPNQKQPNQARPNEYLLDYDAQTHANYPMVGNGAVLLMADAEQTQQTHLSLDAGILAKLASNHYAQHGGVPAEQALPVYLRHNAWKTLKEQGKA